MFIQSNSIAVCVFEFLQVAFNNCIVHDILTASILAQAYRTKLFTASSCLNIACWNADSATLRARCPWASRHILTCCIDYYNRSTEKEKEREMFLVDWIEVLLVCVVDKNIAKLNNFKKNKFSPEKTNIKLMLQTTSYKRWLPPQFTSANCLVVRNIAERHCPRNHI